MTGVKAGLHSPGATHNPENMLPHHSARHLPRITEAQLAINQRPCEFRHERQRRHHQYKGEHRPPNKARIQRDHLIRSFQRKTNVPGSKNPVTPDNLPPQPPRSASSAEVSVSIAEISHRPPGEASDSSAQATTFPVIGNWVKNSLITDHLPFNYLLRAAHRRPIHAIRDGLNNQH